MRGAVLGPAAAIGPVLAAVAWLIIGSTACRAGGEPKAEAAPAASAEATYRKRTCHRCHGREREGTEIGPPLRGLAAHWDVERLMRYIENPKPFQESDPRIAQLVDNYNGRLMKGSRMADPERRALAEWLLADPPAASGAK